MKKLFVSVLAIAGLVACNNEETIAIQGNTPMEFGGSFVENATRAAVDPSTTTNTLDAFDVWAFMDQTNGTVLVDEDVTKSGSKWAYTNVQYWLPEHTYYFTALAPMNSDNWDLADADIAGQGVVSFTNVDGSEDLIYATTEVDTKGMQVGQTMPAVKFAFNHMLSKVKFTFKNGYTTDNVSFVISDVKMTAPAAGTLDLAAQTWTVEGENTYEFGNVEQLWMGQAAEAAQERMTIPAAATQEYNVTFTIDLYMGEVLAGTFEKASTITGATFENGKAYNLVAEITPENTSDDFALVPIEFEVIEVVDWVNQTINGGALGDKWEVVSTIEELQAALDAATGNTSISLGANLIGNVTVPELKGAVISINGNGYTFDGTFALVGGSTYGEGTTIFEDINFATAGLNGYDAFIYCNEQNGNTRSPDNVTIKNCTFAGANELPVGAKFRSLNGTLLITNCKAENMHSLVQLTSCGKATVTIDGAEVENCKNGIGLGQTATAVIKNSTINASEYGVRADGCSTTTDIISSTISAKQPVIVRKATAGNYVLNVDDATVLNNTGLYQVIFTAKSDDVAYVVPTAEFTFNGPADLLVYPSVIVAEDAETLAAALKAENKNINVVLANDIELPISTLGQITGGSGEYKLGGEATETINVDLNGNKLTVTTTYWSNLGAKNDDAVFTIKNGTMTSSQATGTWNSYDLCFSNCNYVFENVAFEKAIALEAANKAYTLKNVTITETHDYYAMWVSAKGQNITIDGLTIESAGRGVKIDEQYVSAPAKVTMNIANATFNTVKKAAIIVKSVEGAEINWGAGNDIANVAADNTFAVWVDEDSAAYANEVVVNGAYSKVEGAVVVANDAEFAEAITNGATNIVLGEGEFYVPAAAKGKTLAIQGISASASTIKVASVQGEGLDYNFEGTTAVINNVTISTVNGNYKGYARPASLTFNDCVFTNTYSLYGPEQVFNNCTFNVAGDKYNVWTWGAGVATFNGCTFNCDGKSLLLYGQANTVLTVNDCVFNDNGTISNKTAIEIGNDYNKSYELYVNNAVVNGFDMNPNGISTGTTLWSNKNSMSQDKLNVVVDGVDVY